MRRRKNPSNRERATDLGRRPMQNQKELLSYSFLTPRRRPCWLNHEARVSDRRPNCLLTFLAPINPPDKPGRPSVSTLNVAPAVPGKISIPTAWCCAKPPNAIFAPLLPFSAFPLDGVSQVTLNPFNANACCATFRMFSTDPFTVISEVLACSRPNTLRKLSLPHLRRFLSFRVGGADAPVPLCSRVGKFE